MKTLQPLKDKIIGQMVVPFGSEQTTKNGLILTKEVGDAVWFSVTHVGPEQDDVEIGQYVLVPHGRWSRGVSLENSLDEKDKLFLIDGDAILGMQNDNPLS